MRRNSPGFEILMLISVLLCGCTAGEPPSKLVQLCLNNDEGVFQFKKELMAVAEARHMKFTDNGDALKNDLETVGYAERTQKGVNLVIHVIVARADGTGISALNVGLPSYQVALGFSAGSDHAEAKRFAEEVIGRLRRHWNVEDVPAGTGAKPSDSCGVE